MFATRPFSFMPSAVAASKALATTLPYFDVHLIEFRPCCTVAVHPSWKSPQI
jgi:hypothetical protein